MGAGFGRQSGNIDIWLEFVIFLIRSMREFWRGTANDLALSNGLIKDVEIPFGCGVVLSDGERVPTAVAFGGLVEGNSNYIDPWFIHVGRGSGKHRICGE